MQKPIFIAEIKTKSPYGFNSNIPFISLMETAITFGDWISVHTNALWGGDFETLAFVRKNTKKPILAKGLFTSNYDILKAFEFGANYVLVVDRQPGSAEGKNEPVGLLDKCQSNIIREIPFQRVKDHINFSSVWKDKKYCCNSRNLSTGELKNTNGFDELEGFLKLGVWVCQASNIKTSEDVNPKVNAFIVGTHLVEFCNQLKRKYE